ncbi:MAG: hypothetical protein ACN4GZ_13200 [Acidimicrobiales bacterium]
MIVNNKNHVDVEHSYRVGFLRDNYRNANQRSTSNSVRRTVAVATVAAASALFFLVPGHGAQAAQVDREQSWIAVNWESLEPSWEPNRTLLAEILGRPERGAPDHKPAGPQ